MVSAFLLLLAQSMSWQSTFVYQNGVFERGEGIFSNGFRYLNWLIDVPMLLIQALADGQHPFSLENLRQVRALAEKRGVV